MKKKTNNPTVKKKQPLKIILIAVIVVVIVGIAAVLSREIKNKDDETQRLVKSAVNKIVDINQLSTFSSAYNGVAKVADPENPEKIDYYVSYEAKVTAGIELGQLKTDVDSAKVVHIKLPEVKITEINVDIVSLDYMFINTKRNQSAVSAEAYKACEEDVQAESDSKTILKNAKDNAEDVVRALVKPFVEQLDPEYTLEIDWEV